MDKFLITVALALAIQTGRSVHGLSLPGSHRATRSDKHQDRYNSVIKNPVPKADELEPFADSVKYIREYNALSPASSPNQSHGQDKGYRKEEGLVRDRRSVGSHPRSTWSELQNILSELLNRLDTFIDTYCQIPRLSHILDEPELNCTVYVESISQHRFPVPSPAPGSDLPGTLMNMELQSEFFVNLTEFLRDLEHQHVQHIPAEYEFFKSHTRAQFWAVRDMIVNLRALLDVLIIQEGGQLHEFEPFQFPQPPTTPNGVSEFVLAGIRELQTWSHTTFEATRSP